MQFGGQTPLKLALALQEAGVRILGTSPDSIDLAEDRQRFSALLSGARHPAAGERHGDRRAKRRATSPPSIGFPVVVRPSYVLGGRGDGHRLRRGDARPLHDAGASTRRPSIPILIDKFLEDAFEFDVDAVADATGAVVIGGIMEHIEEAGIHSGDSSCVVPPFICPERHLDDDPRLHAAHRARR